MRPLKGRHFWTFGVLQGSGEVGGDLERTMFGRVHRYGKLPVRSPVDACGFGDGCCARHVFEEAAHLSTLTLYYCRRMCMISLVLPWS